MPLRPILPPTLALLILAGCSGGPNSNISPQTAGDAPASALSIGSSATAKITPHAVASSSGYLVTLFAKGNSQLSNPDPIVAQGGFTYVAYQNASGATGGGFSTIVQYNGPNHISKQIRVAGRCDGMRFNPYTHEMWITRNEDGSSSLVTWNVTSGSLKQYRFSAAPHGGGYDDLAFANGKAFVAASNPTLNSAGINPNPAVSSITLSGTTAIIKPVLSGDAKARDITTGSIVTLNLTDPDSMAVAPNGDVILVSQADSEIVYIHDAGLSTQTVRRLIAGTQLDDVAYATESDGLIYVVDSKANAVYTVRGTFPTGSLFAEAPGDSGVAGFVGTVNVTTGTITPVIIGFSSPTGLIFVTDRD